MEVDNLVDTTIEPQRLPCTPTYSAAGVQDYVLLTPTTFLHYLNDSATSVALVVSSIESDSKGSYHCYVVSIPAGDETLVGPFNLTRYATIISISTACKYPGDVTVAALWTPLTSVIPRHHDLAGVIHSAPRCPVVLESRGGRHSSLLELDLTVDT